MQLKEERERIVTKRTKEKNYNACLKLILGQEELSENMKIIFKNVCHEPMEQLIYDMVLEDGDAEEPDTMESIVKKGADLYHIHTRLNQKLERSDYNNPNIPDGFLLGCIIGEIQKRKKDFVIPSEEELKHLIYRYYLKMIYDLDEDKLFRKNKDQEYDNFDAFIKYLCKKDRNGLLDIHTVHHLWSLLDMRRDSKFEIVRPTQEELYIFCFALALDYDVYSQLKRLLLKEMEGISEEERQKKYRKGFTGFTDSRRDKVLKGFLNNIETRLECARSALKEGETDVLIPGRMLKNVNEQLEKVYNLRPLTVKTKNGQKLSGRGGRETELQ